MRKLYLVNEKDVTFFFDFRSKTLIESMDGFGFGFDIEYQDYKNTYVETKRTIPQKSFKLNLIFLDGYKGYTKWRDFITSSKKLRLFYTADGTKYCYVNIKSSTKTQLESNILRSSITIECLSLWLIDRWEYFTVSREGEGKVFPYRFPYTYSISFTGSIKLTNKSSHDVPLLLRIKGNCRYPRIVLRQNGVQHSVCKLIVEERESPTIEINADPSNRYIKKITSGDVIEYYDKQDFTEKNFLYLPTGNSEIFFDPGVSEPVRLEIEYKEEYVAH